MNKGNKGKQGSLFSGTVILAGSLAVAKLIGAMYRIPLTNILGSEGIGIYQMVFPLYALLLTLSSSAIPTSLAKLISENLACGEGGRAIGVYRLAKRYIFVISLFFAVAMCLFGDDFARLQGGALGGLSYVAISPSILLVGFVASYRGKFQGMNNMVPTALSQIFEQVSKLVFSVWLPTAYGETISEKVALAILGVTISELCGLAFLWLYSWWRKKRRVKTLSNGSEFFGSSLERVWYSAEREMKISKHSGEQARREKSCAESETGIKSESESSGKSNQTAVLKSEQIGNISERKRDKKQNEKQNKKVRKQNDRSIEMLSPLLKIALPMTVSFSIVPIAGILESCLVINILNVTCRSGVALFGIYSGGVVTMLSFPLGICSSLGTALIPAISSEIARGEKTLAVCKISVSVKVAVSFALAIAGLFLFFSDLITTMIFSGLARGYGGVLTGLLKWSFLNVVVSSFSNITSSVLYSLSKQKVPLISQICGSVVRFVLLYFLLYKIGIYACIVGVFAGGLVSSTVNSIVISKTIKRGGEAGAKNVFQLLLATAGLFLGLFYFSQDFSLNFGSVVILCMIFLGYFGLLFLLKFFTIEELSSFAHF